VKNPPSDKTSTIVISALLGFLVSVGGWILTEIVNSLQAVKGDVVVNKVAIVRNKHRLDTIEKRDVTD